MPRPAFHITYKLLVTLFVVSSAASWSPWQEWTSWSNCTALCGDTGMRTSQRKRCRQSSSRFCEEVTQHEECNRFCENAGTPDGDHCRCMFPYSGNCCSQVASCGQPSSLENGQVIGNAFNYQDTVVYVCDTNFIIVGTEARICNGTRPDWSGPPPLCQFECPCLPGGSCVQGANYTGFSRCACYVGWSGEYCTEHPRDVYWGLAIGALLAIVVCCGVIIWLARKTKKPAKCPQEPPPPYDDLDRPMPYAPPLEVGAVPYPPPYSLVHFDPMGQMVEINSAYQPDERGVERPGSDRQPPDVLD